MLSLPDFYFLPVSGWGANRLALRMLVMANNNPDHFKCGTIVGCNQDAARQGLIRNRQWGTVTSNYPTEQLVTVQWDGKSKTERWHVDLLEIIDWANETRTQIV